MTAYPNHFRRSARQIPAAELAERQAAYDKMVAEAATALPSKPTPTAKDAETGVVQPLNPNPTGEKT